MELAFVDKPAGVSTHTPDGGQTFGFKEHLESKANIQLFVVQRLDRETTGAMILAKDQMSAARLAEKFKNRTVKKSYLLITDRQISGDAFTVRSSIEKVGKIFVSSPGDNAETHFEKLQTESRFTLWRARPSTGRPHQIRLHAAQSAIPILGDEKYGGSEFPALALHAESIEFENLGEVIRHASPPPVYFEDLELLQNPLLVRWLSAVDRRKRLNSTYQNLGAPVFGPTMRWIHTEGLNLRVDQLGEVIHLSWYGEKPNEMSTIRRLTEICGWSKWYLQIRGNRGRQPQTEEIVTSEPAPPMRWTAEESGLTYQFRRDSGLSPGLFLDQRQNRRWLAQSSKDLKVLNLFSYTGGFSLAAARGGAKQIVSVDVSRTFLEWSKENFSQNQFAPDAFEFRSLDSIRYLEWAAKKEIKFDLVICDPPSFSRNEKQTFQIEKDFPQLLRKILDVTVPGGKILFCTNYEKWNFTDLASQVQKFNGIAVLAAPNPDWDFELPQVPRAMKSILING